jgi:hypothetical protein
MDSLTLKTKDRMIIKMNIRKPADEDDVWQQTIGWVERGVACRVVGYGRTGEEAYQDALRKMENASFDLAIKQAVNED